MDLERQPQLALLDFAHQHGANIAQMNADKENRAGTWISVVL